MIRNTSDLQFFDSNHAPSSSSNVYFFFPKACFISAPMHTFPKNSSLPIRASTAVIQRGDRGSRPGISSEGSRGDSELRRTRETGKEKFEARLRERTGGSIIRELLNSRKVIMTFSPGEIKTWSINHPPSPTLTAVITIIFSTSIFRLCFPWNCKVNCLYLTNWSLLFSSFLVLSFTSKQIDRETRCACQTIRNFSFWEIN